MCASLKEPWSGEPRWPLVPNFTRWAGSEGSGRRVKYSLRSRSGSIRRSGGAGWPARGWSGMRSPGGCCVWRSPLERHAEEDHRARLRQISRFRHLGRGFPGGDVVGGNERRVDAAPPAVPVSARRRGQLESQRLPVGVEDAVEQEPAAQRFKREGQGAGSDAPVRTMELRAMPLDLGLLQQLVQAQALVLGQDVALVAEGDELFDEPVHVGVAREETPVEPRELPVLTIRIVVAPLSAAHLVAHQEHRRSSGEQRKREEVLHLPAAKRLDRGILRRSFGSAVPAQVVVRAVAIFFAVGFVVLAVVGDQVIQGEAVVTGDEVDALLRLALLVTVDVGAAQEARGHRGHRRLVALYEVTHVVAKAAVPLLPGVADKAATW